MGVLGIWAERTNFIQFLHLISGLLHPTPPKKEKYINKMELLQSQAPAERELLGSSVVRILEFGNGTFDLRIWTLDIRVWT